MIQDNILFINSKPVNKNRGYNCENGNRKYPREFLREIGNPLLRIRDSILEAKS